MNNQCMRIGPLVVPVTDSITEQPTYQSGMGEEMNKQNKGTSSNRNSGHSKNTHLIKIGPINSISP